MCTSLNASGFPTLFSISLSIPVLLSMMHSDAVGKVISTHTGGSPALMLTFQRILALISIFTFACLTSLMRASSRASPSGLLL